MNGKQVKLLRSQIRNVMQEILPEIMAGEMFKDLQKVNAQRLEVISKEVRETLTQLEERSKAVQDFIVRSVAAAPAEVTPNTPDKT